MSRNAEEVLTGGIELTGTMVNFILEGINKYLLALAEHQIKLSFEQLEVPVK